MMSNFSIFSSSTSTSTGSHTTHETDKENEKSKKNLCKVEFNTYNKVPNKIIIKDENIFDHVNSSNTGNSENSFQNISNIGVLNDKYYLVSKIGEGGTSKVYRAYCSDNLNESYAVKIVKSINGVDMKLVENEILMLKQAQNPNIVKVIEHGQGLLINDQGKKTIVHYIVLEYLMYGELFDFIFFPQIGFGEDFGRYILIEILKGLVICHINGVVHRDIKTENLMVGKNFEIKLADFGFSTAYKGQSNNNILYSQKGTLNYVAPEISEGKPYNGIQADIFSLGVTLFIIVTGKMPFKRAIATDPHYKYFVEHNYEDYWEKIKTIVPYVSEDFKVLFNLMVAYDPILRPSLEEVIYSDWVRSSSTNTITKDLFAKNMNERLNLINQDTKISKTLKKEDFIKISSKNNQDNGTSNQENNNQYLVYRSGLSTETKEILIQNLSNSLDLSLRKNSIKEDSNEKEEQNKEKLVLTKTTIKELEVSNLNTKDNIRLREFKGFNDNEDNDFPTYVLNPYLVILDIVSENLCRSAAQIIDNLFVSLLKRKFTITIKEKKMKWEDNSSEAFQLTKSTSKYKVNVLYNMRKLNQEFSFSEELCQENSEKELQSLELGSNIEENMDCYEINLLDNLSISIEVKKVGKLLGLEFNRLSGNKLDFHREFLKIKKTLFV